jgi:hypothetical protein
MKSFNFLPVVIAMVLLVTAVSCTTMAGTEDGYGRQVYGDRVYVEDPYRGTIVLERDPWSGRYYEVGSPNTYRTYPYSNRVYGSRVYSGRENRNYGRNDGYYYRNNQNNDQRPTQQDNRSRDEARKKVLGN